ncbi:MAG TPA: large-conductance mechanosensitive channel protein MscL [Phototrophicaceae bacterium]|jgi:large conductance mechanosensitive channel|nr:large-conductance mechanosensitive channel protein MscL [Phototrophicaceae bacterium]
MFKEFQKFIMRGNVIDLAVGIIMGTAFGAIVASLVGDVIMPPVGYILGGVDFTGIMTVLKEGTPVGPYDTLAAAKEAGAVVIAWGALFNTIINFLIVAFAVFLLVRAVNMMMERMERLKKKEAEAPAVPGEPTTEEKLLAAIDKLTAVVEKKL